MKRLIQRKRASKWLPNYDPTPILVDEFNTFLKKNNATEMLMTWTPHSLRHACVGSNRQDNRNFNDENLDGLSTL